jgi:hypothetical protein
VRLLVSSTMELIWRYSGSSGNEGGGICALARGGALRKCCTMVRDDDIIAE